MNKKVNQAGEILRNEKATSPELKSAFSILKDWRISHKKTINLLKNQINSIGHESGIVACRIKRLPSIVGKLKRYPNIKLSKIQDVVGMRVILPSIQAVYDFEKSLGFENLLRQSRALHLTKRR
ncbi:MAG: hypothetical protein ACRCU2_27710 [Planktothrix sp.]